MLAWRYRMKHASRVSSGSPNIRYSITNNKKIEKSMSEIFSKNVIINKSDSFLMQGNGIFLTGQDVCFLSTAKDDCL